MCHRTRKYTVCRGVCASFNPEIVQACGSEGVKAPSSLLAVSVCYWVCAVCRIVSQLFTGRPGVNLRIVLRWTCAVRGVNVFSPRKKKRKRAKRINLCADARPEACGQCVRWKGFPDAWVGSCSLGPVKNAKWQLITRGRLKPWHFHHFSTREWHRLPPGPPLL